MSAFRTEWDSAPNPTYDIWTVTNGGEIIPGILTPFTATAFARSDAEGQKALMEQYPSGKDLQLYDAPVGNFFGVFGGRLALNVGYTAAAMSTLDPQIAEAMLQQFFTGATGTERFIIDSSAEERKAAYALATEQREAAPASLAAMQAALYAERRSNRPVQDRALSLAAAWQRHQELTQENTLENLNLHYVVSTAAGEFAVRLAGLLMMGGQDPGLIVALCSGLGDVESSKPAIALYDLATLAGRHRVVLDAIEHESAESVLTNIAAATSRMLTDSQSAHSQFADSQFADDPWAAFAKAFNEFLVLYGFRVQGEADPLNADWSEQPTFVISQVRTMLMIPDSESPRAQQARSTAGREALESQVRAAMPEELRPAFDALVAQAQRFTRMRELSKATWVLGVRRQRHTWLAIADGLAAAGACSSEDAPFLTVDEVEAIANGALVDGAVLAAAITRRKAQFIVAGEHVLPDVWVGEAQPAPRGEAANITELTGLGVSVGAGAVTGVARIVPDVLAAMEREIGVGEILVAPFTDAPWTPLFIPAGGVVVETGGVLSHAATVAREFGIPCVVMVKDATRIIGDGDTVTVDGLTGSVSIVQRAM
jgi:rifampicin phosphotransferase